MSSLLRPALLAFALLALGSVAVALQLWLRHAVPADAPGLVERFDLLASNHADPPVRWSDRTRAEAEKILEARIEIRPAGGPLQPGEIRSASASTAALDVVLRPHRPPALATLWREQLQAFAVLVALAFVLMTIVALAARAPAREPGLPAAKAEIDQLVTLARATAAQGDDLLRERDLRSRTEQAKAMERLRATQAIEDKVRLGRDLHDGMIQSLYAAGLGLESARQHLAQDPARAAATIDGVRETLNAGIRELRQRIAGLTPRRQLGQSFALAVQAVLEPLGAGRAAAFDLRLDPDAAARIDAGQVAELLQLIRESASNALRHGRAKTVTVRLQGDDGRLCLVVEDDGSGFALPAAAAPGHGLDNLRARAAAVGGELHLASEPGGGTRVVLTFPAARPV